MQLRLYLAFLILISTGHARAQRVLTLRGALQNARENNPFLKSDALNVDLSESDVVTAGLRPNPVLNNQSLQLAKPGHFEPGTKWTNGKNQQTWWQLTKVFQLPSQRSGKIEYAGKNVLLSQKL